MAKSQRRVVMDKLSSSVSIVEGANETKHYKKDTGTSINFFFFFLFSQGDMNTRIYGLKYHGYEV